MTDFGDRCNNVLWISAHEQKSANGDTAMDG